MAGRPLGVLVNNKFTVFTGSLRQQLLTVCVCVCVCVCVAFLMFSLVLSSHTNTYIPTRAFSPSHLPCMRVCDLSVVQLTKEYDCVPSVAVEKYVELCAVCSLDCPQPSPPFSLQLDKGKSSLFMQKGQVSSHFPFYVSCVSCLSWQHHFGAKNALLPVRLLPTFNLVAFQFVFCAF